MSICAPSSVYSLAPILLMVLILVSVPSSLAVVVTGSQDTPLDLALPMPKPKGSNLGTARVQPDEDERPSFQKLAADELMTGSILSSYALGDKKGKYIGWYGIIRSIKEDPSTNQTTLCLQHTYCDGQTDTHMMTV